MNLLFYMFSTMLSVWFYLRVLKGKYIKKISAEVMFAAIVISYLPTFLPIYQSHPDAETIIDIFQILWELTVVCVLTTNSIVVKLMTYIGVNLFFALGMIMAQLWTNFRDNKDNAGTMIMAYLIMLAVTFCCMNLAVRWNRIRKLHEPLKNRYGIVFLETALLCLLYVAGMAAARMGHGTQRILLGVLIGFLFLLMVLLQIGRDYAGKLEYQEETAEIQKKKSRDMELVYEELQKQEKKLRGLRWKYEQMVMRHEKQNENRRICENEVIDSILRSKSQRAEQCGCQIQIRLTAEKELMWDNIDIAGLLENLLDNAIEAASAVTEQERKITVAGCFENNRVMLIVSNPYAGEIKRDGKYFQSTKSDRDCHGYGTRQIQSIVDKYQKSMEITTENNIFTVKIKG